MDSTSSLEYSENLLKYFSIMNMSSNYLDCKELSFRIKLRNWLFSRGRISRNALFEMKYFLPKSIVVIIGFVSEVEFIVLLGIPPFDYVYEGVDFYWRLFSSKSISVMCGAV